VGEKGNAYRDFGEKNRRENPLGIAKYGWNDNIKSDLIVIGWVVFDWTHLAYQIDKCPALLNIVINFWVP
jgi:hypothetical protein